MTDRDWDVVTDKAEGIEHPRSWAGMYVYYKDGTEAFFQPPLEPSGIEHTITYNKDEDAGQEASDTVQAEA